MPEREIIAPGFSFLKGKKAGGMKSLNKKTCSHNRAMGFRAAFSSACTVDSIEPLAALIDDVGNGKQTWLA